MNRAGGEPPRHPDEPRPRDRDELGRPRSHRRRDATGRPLPREAGTAAPEAAGPMTAEQALAAAQGFLDAGLPFQAHEVLEQAWRQAEPAERDFWRGLTQLAVALTHRQRGNRRGEAVLLDRAAALLGAGGEHHGVDTARLLDDARAGRPATLVSRPAQVRPS